MLTKAPQIPLVLPQNELKKKYIYVFLNTKLLSGLSRGNVSAFLGLNEITGAQMNSVSVSYQSASAVPAAPEKWPYWICV